MATKKKTTFAILGLVAVSSAAVFATLAATNIFSHIGDADDTNTLIFSSANPIGSDSKIKTQMGTLLYAYAEGVTWNNGNDKVAISNAGFIQNSTLIHGIKSIKVNLVSGSLNLYHDYAEKSNLDKPQYGIDYTFTQTSTYTFTNNYPMYFRLQASEATVVDSVIVSYDCQTETTDENVEDAKKYLENLNIDCGSLGKYATTYYVTGEGNVYGGNSKRALALRFKNTTNNYVSLDTENSKKDKKIDELPDFRSAIFSFKAKFSSDVGDYDMKVCPIGSNWEHPGYILATRSLTSEDGWYTYTVDFKDYQFKDNDQVIRINIEPQGINSSNKNNAVVLLDDIYFPTRSKSLKFPQETSEKGLENIARDEGWENVDVSFNRDMTYGDSSVASMEVTPAPSKKAKGSGPTDKWNFILSPEMSDSKLFERRDIHLNKGMLVFDYKPINVLNPTTLYLGVVKHWNEGGTIKKTVDGGVPTNNGWYRFSYNLSNLGISDEEDVIRFGIGFDTSDSEGKDAKVYFDNIKVLTKTVETIEDGLENMTRDTGWETCNGSTDYALVASQSSTNSLKLTFNGKGVDEHNGVFVCLNPQAQGLSQKCNEGIIEAKFRFSNPAAFATKKIKLIVVCSNEWGAARVDLDTKYIGNNWYLFKADLSNITYDKKDDTFDPSSDMIRLGFGFADLDATNKNDKTVWMDDVFISSNKQSSTLTGVDVWQAYNTEMVLQSESIEDRTVTIDNPLYFEDVRNSIDATQLMLSPTVQDITYNFTPSYLYSDNGDYISPEQFEVLVAKYIEITDYSIEEGKTGWKGEGFYPDALVPIKKIVSANENTVSVNNSQSIWINCSIPKNQTPGTYTGYGILDINGTKVNVPMKVDVHVARLSDDSHNKSCLLLWDDQTVIGEEFNSHVLREEYYQHSINRGINPGGLSDWNSDEYSSFAENFANYVINDPRITTYRLPIKKDSSYIIKGEDVNGYLSALINKNKELWDNGDHVNFFDKLIFYVNDEPKEPDGDSAQTSDKNKESKADWELVKNNLAIINQYKNSLKSQLDNYPELQQSFMDIRNVLPMDVRYDHITGEEYEYKTVWIFTGKDKYPDYFNSTYLDTPCPAYHHLTDETVRSKYAETFKHTWFYGCLLPQLPYSGYHIDNSRLANRLVTWMQYDYNFEGQVYWCTNYYTAEDGTPRDCWNDPYSAGHCAGDGALTYPGKRYNIYGPITTTRFETIRQSYKDYEYFFLFDKNIDLYKQKTGSSVNSCRDYLADAYEAMFNGTAIKQTFTSEQFKTIRHTLLEQLDIVY